MRIMDISPKISHRSPVFPGDQAFERQQSLSFRTGDHLELSWIKSTLHIGAHADAPSHYSPEGVDISQRDLSYYLGRCQVVDVSHVGARRIGLNDLALDEIKASRILFKTNSFKHDECFQSDFSSLDPELIQELSRRDVKLLGIDTPSVDPAESKTLESHQAIFAGDLAILEGIDLSAVQAGMYLLIALPLKIEDADASPLRAILLDEDLRISV